MARALLLGLSALLLLFSRAAAVTDGSINSANVTDFFSPVYEDTWIISNETLNQDCFWNRPSPVVNGMFPGPVVNVREGTRIIITVVNQQVYPMTIHWHGLKQYKSQWHDGVPGVTQCPIYQGESFTYNFSTEGHAGTFWWHTHYGVARNTVLGGFNVFPRWNTQNLLGRRALPPYVTKNFGGDETIILSDWYEADIASLDAGITQYPYQGWPPPDTLLLNGKTRKSCTGMWHMDVQPMKWYMVHVTNGALYASLNFAIQFHTIIPFNGEDGYMTPVKMHSLDIMSGQSYGILFYN
jgi:laccase